MPAGIHAARRSHPARAVGRRGRRPRLPLAPGTATAGRGHGAIVRRRYGNGDGGAPSCGARVGARGRPWARVGARGRAWVRVRAGACGRVRGYPPTPGTATAGWDLGAAGGGGRGEGLQWLCARTPGEMIVPQSGSTPPALGATPVGSFDATAALGSRPADAPGARSAVGDADRARTWAGIVTYLVLTAGLSAIFWRAIIRGGSLGSDGGRLVFGLMWSPAVAGLVTRLLFQRTLRGVGWRLPRGRYLWAGYWVPIAYASVIYLPLWAAGYLDLNAPALARGATMLHLTGAPRPVVLIAYVLFMGTIGMLPNSAAALGEELGWRGFLVPELAKVTSFSRLAPLTGAIWACWHLPLIIGADYRGAGPVWFSIGCFAIGVIGIGYLFAWLRLRSGSVWPAMLLHATHNLFIQAIFDPMTRHTPLTDYTIGEFGLGFAIVASIVACIVWRRRGELPNIRMA